MYHLEFQECSACSKKTGSPILCESCQHNSTIISELQYDNIKMYAKNRMIKKDLNISYICVVALVICVVCLVLVIV